MDLHVGHGVSNEANKLARRVRLVGRGFEFKNLRLQEPILTTGGTWLRVW